MNLFACAVSVAIPTYGREDILLDTIEQFLVQQPPAKEILIIDQTPRHTHDTYNKLANWDAHGQIRWILVPSPSQPAALNIALLEATEPIVLFLDDDIRIKNGFVAAHAKHYEDPSVWAVAGQVIQPNEEVLYGYQQDSASGAFADFNFPFRSGEPAWINNGMSGNMSVRRDKAIDIGGFDENFLPPVSFRFDNDFCKRLVHAGGRIFFEPAASIHHLRAESGGTRSVGSHLTSASPYHGQGDYYFALRQGICLPTFRFILRRPFREIRTRFHLRHPWWIPIKLIGELRAFFLALRLFLRGPKLIQSVSSGPIGPGGIQPARGKLTV